MTRYLVNWPALLLPLVALGTVGLLGGPVPQILVILAVLLALAAPAEGAKIAHLALFAYGAHPVIAVLANALAALAIGSVWDHSIWPFFLLELLIAAGPDRAWDPPPGRCT